METDIIEVRTGSREGVFDITGECERFVARAAGTGRAADAAKAAGTADGLLNVFVPHATAGHT